MPKLAKKAAKKVADQETQEFDALPIGTYVGTLESVEALPGQAIAETEEDIEDFGEGERIPYWKWQFTTITGYSGEEVEEGKVYPGKMWVQTSLGSKSRWKVKEVFEAFGYTPDSDTDEMCGDQVLLAVSQTVIKKGARKGQIGNNVDAVMAYNPEEEGTF